MAFVHVTPYSKEWFDGMRVMEAEGKLSRTVKEIAEYEMGARAYQAMRCVELGKERDAYCWATCAASCAHELIGRE